MIYLSIIIPVFNSESTLRYCLDSIIKQTCRDIEIILINDGSTDSSREILEQYDILDSRIQVFHRSNRGVSAARNYGMSKSRGEYILFVDSDDTLVPNAVETLFKVTQGKRWDTVLFNHNNIYSKEVVPNNHILNKDFFEREHFKRDLYSLLIKSSQLSSCWSRIHKRKVIEENNISFREDMICAEDALFSVQFFSEINSAYYIETPLYNYVRADNSAVTSFKQSTIYSTKIFLSMLYEYLKVWDLNNERCRTILDFRTIHSILSKLNLLFTAKNISTTRERYRAFRSVIEDMEIEKIFKEYKEPKKLKPLYRFQIFLINKKSTLLCFIISLLIHKLYRFYIFSLRR